MSEMGRTLIIIGLVIAAAGAALTFGPKMPWLGNLPGDIHIRRENFSFHFPIATSLLISLVLTLILNWFFRR